MASAQDRKRAPADDVSQEHRPNKKLKSRGRHHGPSNFPPEFWDNLSKVPLTCRALRELDRRNSARPAPGPAAPSGHALQNYGGEPTFDGNAYTYSSTYHAGRLHLFAHHVTPPTVPDGRPEYHMTKVDGWDMTGNIDSFRRGATAFRNARDLAHRHRDGFIQAANARARPSGVELPPWAEDRDCSGGAV